MYRLRIDRLSADGRIARRSRGHMAHGGPLPEGRENNLRRLVSVWYTAACGEPATVGCEATPDMCGDAVLVLSRLSLGV